MNDNTKIEIISSRRIQSAFLFVRLAMVCICLLLFAKLVGKNFVFKKFDERHAQRIQRIFTEKEQTLASKVEIFEQCLIHASNELCLIDFHRNYAQKLNNRGLYIFAYRNDTLYYWTSNDIAIPEIYSSELFEKPYVSLGDITYASGKYASFVSTKNNYVVVALVLIKNVYIHENKFLRTAFQADFALPANVKIFSAQVNNSYPITDSNEQFMWSLIFDGTSHYNYQIYVPALAYLLVLFIFFWMLDSALKILRKNIYLPVIAVVLTTLRIGMQNLQMPRVFYELDLFTPIYFGSNLFSSLGELCLWCLFICFFVVEVYRFLEFPKKYKHKYTHIALVCLALTILILFFWGICNLIKEMVINSSEIFDRWTNPTILVNGLGILGYSIIFMFLFAFYLLTIKTLQLCNQNLKFKYSQYVFIVFVFAMFTAVNLNKHSYVKFEHKKKLLISILASQHDFTAEFLLRDISERIISDTASLVDAVYRDFFGNSDLAPNVTNYVRKQYFSSSYWNRYQFRSWVCNEAGELEINGAYQNCISHFRSVTESMGTKLSRSEFWYIYRPNDISWYLGWFRVARPNEPPLQLFIELWPSSGSDEIGYPELLLDDRLVAANNLKGFSYAKYRNNNRIAQWGEYRYNLTGDVFKNGKTLFYTVYIDNMRHLVYRSDENNMIVLSSFSPKLRNFVFNFSFIFILFSFFASVFFLFRHLPDIRKNFNWSFRNKIQYSMIAVILVSFATISGFTFYYVNNQYMKKNRDIVSEKMRAIYSELQNELTAWETIEEINEADANALFAWLTYFQRLFFTDINLFNARGQLMSTSLPDIFNRGLQGRQINPDAFIKMALEKRTSVIIREDIGGFHYLSAYEVITDDKNRVVAFLNIPYFTPQDSLTEEIANVIMVLMNFYMFIILITVLVSIAMSNQIALPLMMLQEKFKNIKLGAKNEPILYNKRDELKGLVNEYNRAIDELALSAARLARSERESAWREMAQQIAHEINNPLTPMKLSIQHLKRAFDNKSEHFEQYMEKISHSLVEQINTLSEIATEFSNFAKMPAPNNEKIDVIEQINNVVPLFAIDDNKRAFHTNFNGLERAIIIADKEHISRVFVNLLKNAVEAIPAGRQAKISIAVQKTQDEVHVSICDNGIGIPENLQNNIFRPNLSTKPSGMGLGLSIVYGVIENAGGSINFSTNKDEGTTFTIKLPAV